MKNIWFTSDTHFGHENILKYCDRPFDSVEEMNEQMIDNWNSVINNKTVVYHLGDFAYRNSVEECKEILDRLKGKIHLIKGNHDHKDILKFDRWESVSDIVNLKYRKKKLVLFHYPIRSWNGRWRGSIHLYGHVHGQGEEYGKSLDVGVDSWNYKPVSFDQIMEVMENRDVWHNLPKPDWAE